jgi:large subunit ribosomal protein L29
MKPSELRGMSDQELRAKENETAQELFRLRFRHASGQLDNTARLRQLRRELARIKTLLKEREVGRGRAGEMRGK